MARYLTPASIGLLCLVELYTDPAVPVESTVPILSFIVSHLLPSSLPKPQNNISGAQPRDTSLNFIVTPADFEKVLKGHQSTNGLPGRTLWDAFLEKLWDINSLDALHAFFDSRSKHLSKTKEEEKIDAENGTLPPDPRKICLSRTSPMGAYVRRAQLEFTRLKFHDALNLWKSFVSYRHPTLAAYRYRHPNKDMWSFDEVLREVGEVWDPKSKETLASIGYEDFGVRDPAGMVSTNDIEKLLEFQIEQMQSKLQLKVNNKQY